MQKLKCREIISAVDGLLMNGSLNTEIEGISIDSRNISNSDLFIPIKGKNFDGHDFIYDCFEKGALAALTEKDIKTAGNRTVIKVNDTKKALMDLARYYRRKFNIPFTGVTGSVGKTTTKDMMACVLSQNLSVLKTEGNFNNEIGLPLTIFNLDCFHQAAVIEMGMSGMGEISRLTSVTRLDIAVITNIGLSHIEKLGSKQNILKAKLEILEGLSDKGLVILNGDDKLLYGMKNLLKFRTVFYGIDEDDVNYKAFNINDAGEKGTYFRINIDNREYKVYVPVPGIHNIYNALAAIAVGIEIGIAVEKIIEGIGEFTSGKMRLNIISHNGIKVINDVYNANPQSMEAAICVLKNIGTQARKIAVLGDMFEMGDWACKEHMNIGKFAVSHNIDYILTVGENARNIAQGALEAGAKHETIRWFKDIDEANLMLKDFILSGDVILVKGSRGMGMEKIVSELTGG